MEQVFPAAGATFAPDRFPEPIGNCVREDLAEARRQEYHHQWGTSLCQLTSPRHTGGTLIASRRLGLILLLVSLHRQVFSFAFPRMRCKFLSFGSRRAVLSHK
eukprot:5599996-Heterocapsa_arctica.AAC.1